MRGDKACHFSDVTNYGRVWRKDAGKRGLECAIFTVVLCQCSLDCLYHYVDCLYDYGCLISLSGIPQYFPSELSQISKEATAVERYNYGNWVCFRLHEFQSVGNVWGSLTALSGPDGSVETRFFPVGV